MKTSSFYDGAVLNMVCSVCILEAEFELFNLKRLENPGIRKSLAIVKWKAMC